MPELKTIPYSLLRNAKASIGFYWRLNKKLFITHIILILVQVVSSVLAIFFTSRIIGELANILQDPSWPTDRVYIWLAATIGATLAESFAWRWLNFVDREMWISWYVKTAVDFNSAVASLDMEQHHDVKFQKTLSKLIEQYQYVPQNFTKTIFDFFHACARLASSLIIVLTFAPLLVPVMIISLLPSFLTEKKLSKQQWSLWDEKGDRPRLAWRTASFLQQKNELQETKIFNTKPFLLKKIKGLYGEFYDQQLQNLRKIKRPAFGSLLTETIVLIGINAWLIYQVTQRVLSLANFTFYSGVIAQFSNSLGLIVNSVAFLYDRNEYMKDFYQLFDAKPKIISPSNAIKLPVSKVPTIEFRNVSFKYPSSDTWALHNVSFAINPGDKVAFVGENGAGKTTIIRLLLRFYDCNEGQIIVDGTDIKKLDLLSYYHHIGVLFQNFNDYPYSVRDNIALGRLEKFNHDELVIEAAKAANADPIIQKYPKKYDQILEIGFKDGIEPSGGEWQRIALARALFRNANVLILDEPTAAVDANSEYQIFKTLGKHSADKTTVIISHRFSTVRTAKKIFVISDGKIKESGSHEELMSVQRGIYRKMFTRQAEGYK